MDRDELQREAERWRRQSRFRPETIQKPGPGQESVWDYPRPPRIEAASQRIRVEFGGVTLADSARVLRIVETAGPPTYYVPPADVRTDLLVLEPDTTLCEWKGSARYWSAQVGERRAARACWGYAEPFAGFAAIRDHFAFFPGRVDACFVGGERVSPQPGDFYGGWITQSVVGPFKGGPGSENW